MLNMKKKTTKQKLGEDMLRFIIKLYEAQEKIKITYKILDHEEKRNYEVAKNS